MNDSTVAHLRRATKVSRTLGYLPYKWCAATKSVIFDSSPRARALFFLQLCLYWSYLFYLNLRALYVTYVESEGTTASTRTEMQYIAVGYFAAVPFQLCSLYFYGQHHFVINKYFEFRRELIAEWNGARGGDRCKSASGFCRGTLCLTVVNILSNVMPIWTRPRAVNLITALIPGVEQLPKFLLAPFAILQFFIAANTWIMVYSYMTFTIGLVADVSNRLGLMR